jgi:ribose 5-phosphate isomerase B
MIKIWIASDHAGFELKKKIVHFLSLHSVERHYQVHDLGPDSTDSVDYPDYADAVCEHLLRSWTLIDTKKPENTHLTEVGILVCGSGQGMCMRANKYPSVRAALCCDEQTTRLAREHNDANVLCLGGRQIDHDLGIRLVEIFLTTPFAGGRHQARVAKVSAPIGE